MRSNRKRSSDIAIFVIQLVFLIAIGCAFSPFFRGLVLWGLLLCLAAGALAVTYRLIRSLYLPPLPTVAVSDSVPFPAVTNAPKTLANRLWSIDWFQFERATGALYASLGYSVERCGGANPDGGIDLVVTKAQRTYAVQCKHWKTYKVRVDDIRSFAGALADPALAGRGIHQGIFVTTGEYTEDAKQCAERLGIQLVGLPELEIMFEAADWQYNPALNSIFYDERKICPKCESEMVLRTAGKGFFAGHQFWGCSAYPKCRYIMRI